MLADDSLNKKLLKNFVEVKKVERRENVSWLGIEPVTLTHTRTHARTHARTLARTHAHESSFG